jgi:hypothetical protein
MMAKPAPNARQTGYSNPFPGGQNLDAPRVCPYTSAVPKMDVI